MASETLAVNEESKISASSARNTAGTTLISCDFSHAVCNASRSGSSQFIPVFVPISFASNRLGSVS